jgi:hypothetical protein
VPADHVHPIGRLRLRAAQRGDHIGDACRLRNSRADGLDEALELDAHPAAGPRRIVLKLTVDPVPRGADAPVRIVLRRQRVPRAERGEPADRPLDPPRADFPEHVVHLASGLAPQRLRRMLAATRGAVRCEDDGGPRRHENGARPCEQPRSNALHHDTSLVSLSRGYPVSSRCDRAALALSVSATKEGSSER